MFQNVIWWQALVAMALAIAPIVIWTNIFFKRKQHSKKALIEVFILGTFTVIPLIAIQYLWYLHPEWDVNTWIENKVYTTNVQLGFLATFIVIGMMEEVVKMGVVRIADASKMRLQTINDAVKFSILAALGFAFSENIYYFYSVMSTGNLAALFTTVVFRGSFTVCGHIIFSAIFGYYYGLGKFSQHIVEQNEWTGEKFKFATFINKLTGIKKGFTVKYQKLLTGLIIAMSMHALFNFFLQLNRTVEATILVATGFIYVYYLMNRKAGHLILTGEKGESMMPKTDEDVVLELIGMWFNDGKYEDVIEICERLLLRDPNNKVVKLFKAKALDKAKMTKAVSSVKNLFSEKDEENPMNILEELRKKKQEMEQIENIKKSAEIILDKKTNTLSKKD
ncbi:MAG: PrsW family intramembrane metalloprotease [Patescibacteria group bacterium]|nr:PrsW family intramembrane metalloprotease [Patescibacteria group bacterium]